MTTTKRLPRQGSQADMIFQTMENAQHHKAEFPAPVGHQGTTTATVNRLRHEHFNGADFYTRTRSDGVLLIGFRPSHAAAS